MSLASPYLLLALLLVPLRLWLSLRAARRGRAEGFAFYPGLALFALARPSVTLTVPDSRAGVMLAMDVSGSMELKDIAPSRLKAARQLLGRLPRWVKVGLVSFSGEATLVAPLTLERGEVIEQIGLLSSGTSTAIGRGLQTSLGAFPQGETGRVEGSSIVVLLSDGQSLSGIDPLQVARRAARLGVRVYTVGVGRSSTGTPDFDEATLSSIAKITGGRYYTVTSAPHLSEVYQDLSKTVGWERRVTEVSGLASLGAGLMLAGSVFLAQRSLHVV